MVADWIIDWPRGAIGDGLRKALQLGVVERAVADLHLHGGAGDVADALDGGRRNDQRGAVVDVFDARRQALVEAEQILAFFALIPVLEDDVGDAGIGEAGAVVERGEAGDGDDLFDAGLRLDAGRDVVERARGALQRGALGKLHDDEEVALVLDGQEAGRHAAQAVHGETDEAGDDQRHDATVPDHALDQPSVGVLERVIDAVEAAIEEVALLGRRDRAQPKRALRRLQRHGVDRRDQRRSGDDERELAVHLAGQPGQERRRDEHRHEHQRDAEDRPEQLVHRLDGGIVRRQPMLDVLGRAFDHDDGVVDDDADGEDDGEQRRQVHA